MPVTTEQGVERHLRDQLVPQPPQALPLGSAEIRQRCDGAHRLRRWGGLRGRGRGHRRPERTLEPAEVDALRNAVANGATVGVNIGGVGEWQVCLLTGTLLQILL